MKNLFYIQSTVAKPERRSVFALFDNVSTGHFHVVALLNGTVYSWGLNTRGQLGVSDTVNKLVPTPVYTAGELSGRTVTKAVAGTHHTLCLDSDGKLYSWGDNDGRQLGTGSTSVLDSQPKAVTASGALSGKTIVDMAGGRYHSLCLDSDGKVYAWGDNSYGEVGDGSFTLRATPVDISNSGALAGRVVSRIYAGASFSLAMDSTGALISWGRGSSGQLGTGVTGNTHTPALVDVSGVLSGKVIKQIQVGDSHVVALTAMNDVVTWGNNSQYQLGVGDLTQRNTPVLLTQLGDVLSTDIRSIVAGGYFTGVITRQGRPYLLGHGTSGQLGNNTVDDKTTLTSITMSGVLAGKSVNNVFGGMYFCAAVDTTGQVYTWGENLYGQLGNNRAAPTETRSLVPVEVT